MEALRSAGRAIMRSPSITRHSPRHHKLPENWTDTKETLMEGMVFQLKYLGMTLVEKPKGEDMASAAIRRIIVMARGTGKKLQKVTVIVTPSGISIQDAATNEIIEKVSIYRISYCTTDKVQDKVFAYVAQNQSSEALECHAFLCSKKKTAQAVTLTVAQAFNVALDLWESAKEGKEQSPANSLPEGQQLPVTNHERVQADEAVHCLIATVTKHTAPQAASQEEEDEDELYALEDAFSRLAESRASELLPPEEVTLGDVPG